MKDKNSWLKVTIITVSQQICFPLRFWDVGYMHAPWIIYIHVKLILSSDGQLALQRNAAISVYFILSRDDSM